MSATSAAMRPKQAKSCAQQAQDCSNRQSPRNSLDPIIAAADLRPEDPIDLSFLEEPELPGIHLFPEELIRHLQERLRIATGENGRLRRSLAIEEARNASFCSGGAEGGQAVGGGNNLAAKQIVALAKRVRQLSAEGEATKRQLAELRRKENANAETAQSNAAQECEARDEKPGRRVDSVEHLQEQLAATKLRLCESRNQCQELKQRLQQANKALEDEVGAGAGDSRRGRAQQIMALQRKVTQLQAQLQGQGGVSDDLQAPRVRHEERERRAAMDKMAADLERATQAQEAARLKCDAARARCKALETENAAQRRRIETLADEAEKDSRIIDALKSEVSASSEREAARARELTAASQWREQCEFLREELRRMQIGAMEARAHVDEEVPVEEPVVVEPPPDSGRTQASVEHLLQLTERLELRANQERRVAHDAQVALRKEQVRSARFQARLAQLEVAGKAQQAVSGSRGYVTRRDEKVNDAAQLQVELLREELLAAQAQLACVERDKQEDLRLFTAALQDAHSSSEGRQSGQTTSKVRTEDGREEEDRLQGAHNVSPRRMKELLGNSPRGCWLEMAALENHQEYT